MPTFHFDLVSPEQLAFSGEVDQVDIPGREGDFGVLAGHAPVVAAVRPGILTIITGGSKQKLIVLGGLAEVSDKGLTLLADVATSIDELDRAKFAETISDMEAKVAEKGGLKMGHGLIFMKRKIAAIFAADIAGYSRLVAEDEEETLRRLAAYRGVTDDFIAKAGGRVFHTAGGGGAR